MTRAIAPVDQMTQEELEAAETLVRRNLQTIGMALKIIRDRRGYLTARQLQELAGIR